MKCPGQDRRYWKEDAVYEVPCPNCGASVELFKDENAGRCRSCGHRFINPGADFGCAKWCALAEECLGFAPQREPADSTRKGAMAARLIQAVKDHFGADQGRIGHALIVFQHANELVRKEGGDPRVVLAAALLLAVAGEEPAQGIPKVRQILEQIGIEDGLQRRVCEIIRGCGADEDLETVEFRVVWDSQRLVRLAMERPTADPDQWESVVQKELKTESGKQKARALLPA